MKNSTIDKKSLKTNDQKPEKKVEKTVKTEKQDTILKPE